MIQLPPPTITTAEELLRQFEQTGETAPFEEIVRRYSGMVYGVCYRVTRNAHDAEDATQATFLKLATYARTGFGAGRGESSGPPRIGPWLQQVAKTTAVDLRRSKTRRQNREQIRAAIEDQQQPTADATDDVSMDELKQVLRDEVDRLPVHYRTPLILYYFGGLSTEQIAVELKTNAKALAVRLFRARKVLGGRLTARGIGAATGTLACLAVADSILAALAGKVWQTASSAGSYGGGMYASAGGGSWLTSHSAVVSTIAGRINATMRATAVGLVASKWKMSIAMLLTVGTTMAGTSEVVQQAPVVRDVAHWLQSIGQSLRDLSNFGRMFQGTTPQPRAQAVPDEAAPPPSVAQAPVPVPAVKLTPAGDVSPAPLNLNKAARSIASTKPIPQNNLWPILSSSGGGGADRDPVGPMNRQAIDRRAGGTAANARLEVPSAGQSLLAMSTGGRDSGSRKSAALLQGGGNGKSAFVGPVALAAATEPNFQQLLEGTSHSRVGPSKSAGGSTTAESNPAYGQIATGPADLPGQPSDLGASGTDAIGIVDPAATMASTSKGTSFPEGETPWVPLIGEGLQLTDPVPPINPTFTPPATQPIPEPGSLGLLALSAAGLLARRRRRH